MRRSRPTSRTTWPVTVAAFLLGFVAVVRWQQWQDVRQLRQMTTLPPLDPSPPTAEDDNETVSRYRDSG